MASSFENAFAATFNAAAIPRFGETTKISYATQSIDAVVLKETRRQRRSGSINDEYEEMMIYVKVADVAAPHDQFRSSTPDAVVIATENWIVAEVVELNVAGLHKLLLKTMNLRD